MNNLLDMIKNNIADLKLIIFAEGTTSNGIGLLDFKKGAFVQDVPLKVLSLKYYSKVSVAYCGLNPFDILMLNLSTWFAYVNIVETECCIRRKNSNITTE